MSAERLAAFVREQIESRTFVKIGPNALASIERDAREYLLRHAPRDAVREMFPRLRGTARAIRNAELEYTEREEHLLRGTD